MDMSFQNVMGGLAKYITPLEKDIHFMHDVDISDSIERGILQMICEKE